MISLLLSLLLTNFSFAEEQMLNIGWGCDLRVVVESPKQVEAKADVLFLIGFSDRADNHGPLFSQLTQSGFRVISFDYPSHGKTKCRSLGVYDLMSLARLARSVLQSSEIQSDRPLYVGGWSTGGLLAYRMMQQEMFYFRNVKGLVLLAPGLAVYKIPGDAGVVTLESLLSNPNPPHLGEISPTSPLLYPLFGADLIGHSIAARLQAVPKVPILMILGGDEADVYAKTPKIKKWYKKLKAETPQFISYQCAQGKHELDNEIEPMGQAVRDLFVDFLNEKALSSPSNICTQL